MYKLIISGGTFDRLHEGHKKFLKYAFANGEKVLIGLTSDKYVKNYKNGEVLSFSQRKKERMNFLSLGNLLKRAEIVAIDTKFDQTLVPDSQDSALLVTTDTYSNGLEINRQRLLQKLSPLPLLVMPVLEVGNTKISSSKIREGKIDRKGNLILDTSFISRDLFLPNFIRQILHKPFGTLFLDKVQQKYLGDSSKIISVGDVTTKRLNDLGKTPKLAIIDYKIERKKIFSSLNDLNFSQNEKVFRLNNQAGTISRNSWDLLTSIIDEFKNPQSIALIVDGEEDLLVIPLILLLPLGFYIFYGQPKEGLVVIEVTEEAKSYISKLLSYFTH